MDVVILVSLILDTLQGTPILPNWSLLTHTDRQTWPIKGKASLLIKPGKHMYTI